MTIQSVKSELSDHLGKDVVIKYSLGRNKYEKYNATIKELYNYVFLVELKGDEEKQVKSFSYSDVITKTIKIDF